MTQLSSSAAPAVGVGIHESAPGAPSASPVDVRLAEGRDLLAAMGVLQAVERAGPLGRYSLESVRHKAVVHRTSTHPEHTTKTGEHRLRQARARLLGGRAFEVLGRASMASRWPPRIARAWPARHRGRRAAVRS